VLEISKSAGYLLAIVVGRLVPSTEGNFQEVCLDYSPNPIPLRDIISCLMVGTANPHLIGKPKFFIFIDDGKQEAKLEIQKQVKDLLLQ